MLFDRLGPLIGLGLIRTLALIRHDAWTTYIPYQASSRCRVYLEQDTNLDPSIFIEPIPEPGLISLHELVRDGADPVVDIESGP